MKKSKLKKYEHVREQCKKHLTVSFPRLTQGFIPGAIMVMATVETMPMPVGTLWFNHGDGSTVSILSAYVEKYVRRCGVLTALTDAVIDAYPHLNTVTTGRAWSQSSKRWMLKQGYKQRKDGSWRLKIKRKVC